MRKEERYKGVLNWFNGHVPVAETELDYDDQYQLLIGEKLDGEDADARFRRRRTIRYRRVAKVARRRPQDGKRHSLGRLQQASNGCRHTCVPRSQPHRPDKQQQNPVGNGKGVCEAFPVVTNPDRPPLVDPARTLHLYRPQAQMRRMWSQTLV